MNASLRCLCIAITTVALAACGNKGPLVRAAPPAPEAMPAPVSPPVTDPNDTLPIPDPTPPADADPGGAVPAVAPAPPGDGGGHG